MFVSFLSSSITQISQIGPTYTVPGGPGVSNYYPLPYCNGFHPRLRRKSKVWLQDFTTATRKLLKCFECIKWPFLCSRFLDYRSSLSSNYAQICDYIYKTYIGSTARPLRFPIQMWNAVERLEDDLPRTTNSCVGFNNGLARRMRACRPDLGMCAEQLILEQAVAENRIIQANSGLPPRAVIKAQKLSEKLRKCYSTYNVKPLKDYLRGIALNFQFNY